MLAAELNPGNPLTQYLSQQSKPTTAPQGPPATTSASAGQPGRPPTPPAAAPPSAAPAGAAPAPQGPPAAPAAPPSGSVMPKGSVPPKGAAPAPAGSAPAPAPVPQAPAPAPAGSGDIIGATGFNYTQRWGSQRGAAGNFNMGSRPPAKTDWDQMSQEERIAVGIPDEATWNRAQAAWLPRNQVGGDNWERRRQAGEVVMRSGGQDFASIRQALVNAGYDEFGDDSPLFKEIAMAMEGNLDPTGRYHWNGSSWVDVGTSDLAKRGIGGMADYNGPRRFGLDALEGLLPGVAERNRFQTWNKGNGLQPTSIPGLYRATHGQLVDDLGYTYDPKTLQRVGHYVPGSGADVAFGGQQPRVFDDAGNPVAAGSAPSPQNAYLSSLLSGGIPGAPPPAPVPSQAAPQPPGAVPSAPPPAQSPAPAADPALAAPPPASPAPQPVAAGEPSPGAQAPGAAAAPPAPAGPPSSPTVPTGAAAAAIPPGVDVQTPVGTYRAAGATGQPEVVLNQAGQQAYQAKAADIAVKYTGYPFEGDPTAPMPPVEPGGYNFNPFSAEGWV